jgi:eukaryotic-like serine/threonine-protein kinase
MISEQGPSRPLHADDTPTEVIQAIGKEQVSLPSRPPEVSLPTRTRERRQLRLSAALALVIVAIIGVSAYEVASGVGHKPHAVAAAGASATSRARVVSRPASPSPAPSPTTASPSPSPSPSARPSPSASPVAVVQALKPAGVTAVGPGGGTGDDPGSADLVIDGSTSTGWQTDWYDTAAFGGLQTGTGLLVDMGHTVTVSSVQVTLGPAAGNDLEVRVGDSSSVSSLTTVATESGAGGTVQLKLAAPTQARYVLIWFTSLAPDGAGTYQAKVYNITVSGQP